MKPILVNNNGEWLRLAPVLEKQGHTWGENCTPLQYNPFTSGKTYYSGGAIVISFGWGILSWRHFSENSGETQSVDEYLTHAKSETVEYANCCGRCIDGLDESVLEPKEPDYKALYEAQTRAIEEALVEMDKEIESEQNTLQELCQDREGYDAENKCAEIHGLSRAKEILTNKLK